MDFVTTKPVIVTSIKEELKLMPLEDNENILIDTAKSGKSCGEVFIVDNDNFWIMCRICCERFDNIQEFIHHVIHIHLIATEIATEIIIDSNSNNNSDAGIMNNLEPDEIDVIEYQDKFLLETEEEEVEYDPDTDPDSDQVTDSVKSPMLIDVEVELDVKTKLLPPIKEEIQDNVNVATARVKNRCHLCNKVFNRPCKLQKHLKVHEKRSMAKVYKCGICAATFTKQNLYRNHRDNIHKKRIQCEYCEKTFGNKYILKEHINMHKNERVFQCDQCPSNYYAKASLNGHIRRVHLMERPHACHICDKKFMRSSALKIHIRIHTGEKPFVCELCGSSYQTSSLLGNHIKRHNNDRRYACDECDKKFFNHTYLRDHKISVHTQEKPFSCEVCKAKFSGKAALRKHKKLHLGTKSYICSICGKAYAQSPGLYAHMKSHQISTNKNIIENINL